MDTLSSHNSKNSFTGIFAAFKRNLQKLVGGVRKDSIKKQKEKSMIDHIRIPDEAALDRRIEGIEPKSKLKLFLVDAEGVTYRSSLKVVTNDEISEELRVAKFGVGPPPQNCVYE